MATVTDQLNTVAFSYHELDEQGFHPKFIEDYLDQIRNIRIVAEGTDTGNELAEDNKDRLDALEPRVTQNEADIAQNEQDIDALDIRVTQNETDISQNASDILALDGRVTQNESDIAQNALDLDNHELLTSAHGVTGSNVGTGDYCTLSIGGVVNLAALVADLTQIVTADIGPAPAAYDQTYTQSVTDLVNEEKAKINEIVDKINEILAGQQAAFQMSSV